MRQKESKEVSIIDNFVINYFYVHVLINAGVICEDAIKMRSNKYIKDTEAEITKTNELVRRAIELIDEYENLKKQLQKHEEIIAQLNTTLETLQKRFDEQTKAGINKEIEATRSQMNTCRKELSKVKGMIASSLDDLKKAAKLVRTCQYDLEAAKVSVTKCNDELEDHLVKLKQEHDIKIQHIDDQISSAKKWGFGGLFTMGIGGVVIATSVILGKSGNLVNYSIFITKL